MNIIKYPLTTEKSIRLMESENKLTFIVDLKASKDDIKNEVEKIFKVKVTGVSTTILPGAKKKAYVTLSLENPAIDIATQLGLM
ncbi:MAG: 50S ribosomal protein L23 [Candidatus Nanoarchaeia archaeon]|nr:50S ribosomal protein L23 [Candidatus Nanoarchaeia archaeon]